VPSGGREKLSFEKYRLKMARHIEKRREITMLGNNLPVDEGVPSVIDGDVITGGG